MFFAIRDDDLNYFTTPEQIADIYTPIWDICPISFSTVPFHGCTKSGGIPEAFWKGEQSFPLHNNRTLVEFLLGQIQANHISITLHGYDHKDQPDGYEFGRSGVDLQKKIATGKKYLEDLLRYPIKVFVPPHNSISQAGLKAVIENHLHLANIVSFSQRIGPLHPSVFLRVAMKKVFSWRHRGRPYPYILDFGTHKEVQCRGLIPSTHLDELLRKFDFCYRMEGVFVLAAHYWEYDTPCANHPGWKMKDVLCRFWDTVQRYPNIQFVSLNQLLDSSEHSIC